VFTARSGGCRCPRPRASGRRPHLPERASRADDMVRVAEPAGCLVERRDETFGGQHLAPGPAPRRAAHRAQRAVRAGAAGGLRRRAASSRPCCAPRRHVVRGDPGPLLRHRGRRVPFGLPLELGGPQLEQLRAKDQRIAESRQSSQRDGLSLTASNDSCKSAGAWFATHSVGPVRDVPLDGRSDLPCLGSRPAGLQDASRPGRVAWVRGHGHCRFIRLRWDEKQGDLVGRRGRRSRCADPGRRTRSAAHRGRRGGGGRAGRATWRHSRTAGGQHRRETRGPTRARLA